MTEQPPTPPPVLPHADPAYDQAPMPPREPMFRVPAVTGWLIALNVLVQVARMFLSQQQDNDAIENLAFETGVRFDGWYLLSLLTYQFAHANWTHLIVNMTALLAFGSGMERALPGYRIVLLYLGSGIVAALFEAATADPSQNEALLGASGSISGIFGALIVLMALNRRGSRPVSLPLMLALVLGPMIVTGVFNIGSDGLPVAWRAHVGGFGFGVITGWIILQFHRRRGARQR